MTKKVSQTPAATLKALLEEYRLNPFSLAKKIGLSTSAVRQITIGVTGITIPTALRLSKFFGHPPSFWLDLQLEMGMEAAANDRKLQDVLKGISKYEKPTGPPKEKAQAGKRKAAAKPSKKSIEKK
ncbi:MAG: HigA family addiction module antitoxin [Treponema sp.]|nr:HigA family addiction module antitoxin [Treponema sp.]